MRYQFKRLQSVHTQYNNYNTQNNDNDKNDDNRDDYDDNNENENAIAHRFLDKYGRGKLTSITENIKESKTFT